MKAIQAMLPQRNSHFFRGSPPPPGDLRGYNYCGRGMCNAVCFKRGQKLGRKLVRTRAQWHIFNTREIRHSAHTRKILVFSQHRLIMPVLLVSKVSTRCRLSLHWRVVVRASVMDEKELEMLDKVLRTANLVHLRDKFVSKKVQEMLCYRIILL